MQSAHADAAALRAAPPAAAAVALAAELRTAAAALARALGQTRRDAHAFARLRALLALLRAAADLAGGAAPVARADDEAAPLASALRDGLGALSPRGCRRGPRRRHPGGDARRAALRTPVGDRPQPAREAAADEGGGDAATGGDAAGGAGGAPVAAEGGGEGGGDGGDGALLSLLVQLAGVELAMGLHDQPDEKVTPEVAEVLPACCALLEEALFRLHSDADDEDDEDGGGGGGASGGDPWLGALSDAQLLSAQRAFHAALKSALDFAEAVRAESAAAGGGDGGASHPLLLPVARLISAWLAQPSAPEALKLYDRACALVPLLRAASEGEEAAWATELRRFRRVGEAEAAADDDDAAPAGGGPGADSMAALFEKLLRRAEGETDPDVAELLKKMGAAAKGREG